MKILIRILPAILIICVLFATYKYAASNDYLVCDTECGETLIAISAADDFKKNGVVKGLLERMGGDDAHPLYYTHNVNIGSLTYILAEQLGFDSLDEKILIPLAGYGLGLLLTYLFIRKITDSIIAGILGILIFSCSYWGLGSFSTNALRSWHFPSLLLLLYGLSGLIKGNESLEFRDYFFIAAGAVLAFGCGYDYWVIVGCVSIAMIICSHTEQKLRSTFKVGLIFLLPFIIRQIHVGSILGLEFLLTDIKYSAGIKIPYASSIITIPNIAEIDKWYYDIGVARPPAYPTNDFKQIFATWWHMLNEITVPRLGSISICMYVLSLIFGFLPRTFGNLSIYSRRVMWPLTIGVFAGLLVFAPFSMHVYFKHEFPLFIFLVLISKTIVIYFLFLYLIKENRIKIVIPIMLVVVLDMYMTHTNSTDSHNYNNFGWVAYVREHNDKKFAVAAHPYGKRLDNASYIDPKDFDGTDVSPWSGKYDFLIYQPLDRLVDFDRKRPSCEFRDWVAKLLIAPRKANADESCIYGYKIPEDYKSDIGIEDISKNIFNNVVEIDYKGIGYAIISVR